MYLMSLQSLQLDRLNKYSSGFLVPCNIICEGESINFMYGKLQAVGVEHIHL